ncbi:MAG: UDP-N-acetylmuramoyl-tripeptide--D-alanyl-D-alanine ligase [Rickettsiaceae bacterium]|nr:UDP-N-acetylmuramoyl-tripeptide--D-alanyl-D-alanine ligase [Rickettsiaceae bacterium]
MHEDQKFKMIWNSQNLSEALGVDLNHKNISASEIHINSKNVTPGSIFLALNGTKTDGHNYVAEALEMGAAVAIVSKIPTGINSDKLILVDDCLEALNLMAKYKRTRSKAKFIGITGSVGKTSLKEAAKYAFTPMGNTFSSRGNFNNNLGLLINLASMPDDAEYCIFELGMNKAGEIRILTNILLPDFVIINNIHNTHQVNFFSIKDIALAKAEILEGLDAKTGIVILPKNNEFYSLLKEQAKKLMLKNIYDFGENDNFSSISLIETTETKAIYKNNLSNHEVIVNHNNLPNYHLLNFAPILLIGDLMGLNTETMAEGLKHYKIFNGRGNIIHVEKNDFYIVDDSYNSSPSSLEASIKYFSKLKAKRKIILIGDMLELGKIEVEEHARFVNIIKNSAIDLIITYGSLASEISKGLKGQKVVFHCDSLEAVKDIITSIIKPKDYILVKASASTGLSEIVSFLVSSQI